MARLRRFGIRFISNPRRSLDPEFGDLVELAPGVRIETLLRTDHDVIDFAVSIGVLRQPEGMATLAPAQRPIVFAPA